MLGTYSDPLSTSATTESYSRLRVAALGMRNLGRALFVSVFRPPRGRFLRESQECGVCNQIRVTARGCLKPNKELAVSCFVRRFVCSREQDG